MALEKLLVLTCLTTALGVAPGGVVGKDSSDLSHSKRVGSGVFAELALRPTARVFVIFEFNGEGGTRSDAIRSEDRGALARVSHDILDRIPAGEFRLHRHYQLVNGFAGEVTAKGLAALLQDARVLRVDLDEGGVGHLAEAIPLADIDSFQSLGFSGEGVTVAVIDSGYDTNHPDLVDDLVAEQCFCSDSGNGCCPNGSTTQSGPGSAEDDNGHGTNVSGIITSKGTISHVGVSPNAGVVAIKVLDASNAFCCASDVIAALDWIFSNRQDVTVVNMSLGSAQLFSGDCDNATSFTMGYSSVVQSLRSRGVTVFASTGNAGSGTGMAAPACIGNVMSIGAVWDSNVGSQTFLGCTDVTTAADQVTCFSNSDSQTDLFAPGAYTTSTGIGGGTSTFGGTSQASPLVAGCAALLLEKAPGTTPARLEERLKASPTLVTDSTNALSFPRLSCYDAGVPCTSPVTLDLSTNQTVLGSIEETACERIEAGPYGIGSTGDVVFSAGSTIVLRDGFSVAAGGSFRAVIDGLLVPPPPL